MELVPQLKLADRFISDNNGHLLAEAETGRAKDRLYAELLSTALAGHCISRYSSAALSVHKYTGGLTPRRLRLAIEFIDVHLDEDISFSQLAELLGMNSYYFARLFKQSTGRAAHRYMIEQRGWSAPEDCSLIKNCDHGCRLVSEVGQSKPPFDFVSQIHRIDAENLPRHAQVS